MFIIYPFPLILFMINITPGPVKMINKIGKKNPIEVDSMSSWIMAEMKKVLKVINNFEAFPRENLYVSPYT
jgi:hypothetical protein